MNKLLHLSHVVLVLIVVGALFYFSTVTTQLWQTKELNTFIANTELVDEVPKSANAEFAQAFYANEQNKYQRALELLTRASTSNDADLKASAYFNRGNINLRQALTLQVDDPKKIPLIELAKQDYRTALLLKPALWDARYNLEVALNVVPEVPVGDGLFDKPDVGSRKSIEAVGFKVDLP